ncbi:hypothetical protein SEA_MUCHMORE_3 [Mycobacterium phage MuchMore]|uniref:Uncharacterized protein n=1 Tax=Mycobacterium phage MuchMore TaxID=2301606 RepID=A0A385UG14_9CAUD|nr:hypothetical protein SEA_MUCHMORE_3 [Mycobacterium phage MuchMore]
MTRAGSVRSVGPVACLRRPRSTTSVVVTTIHAPTYEPRARRATARSHPLRATPGSGSYEPGGSDRPNATLAAYSGPGAR